MTYTVTIDGVTHRTSDFAIVEKLTAQAVEDGKDYTVIARKEVTEVSDTFYEPPEEFLSELHEEDTK